MRMPSLKYRLIDIEPQPPFSLPSPVQVSKVPTSTKELYEVHRLAANDFVSPESLGYVNNRDAVAGFESHRFNSLNQAWQCGCSSGKWQVIRLELVGLLRNKPRVYIAKTPPRLDQIANAPHRELNQFEKNALRRLTSEQDVVYKLQPDRIQMLGALAPAPLV